MAKWGSWLQFDGQRWETEHTLLASHLARSICNEFASKLEASSSLYRKLESKNTITSVEILARADRRIAALVDQWDADTMLLNTPDGVVDLRTGLLKPHDPEHYLTKITAVGPSSVVHCPVWLAFLHRTFAGDVTMLSYVQRAFGYCLTGSTKEHALFFGHGTGGNGKSVLLNVLTGILGDYAKIASMATFEATSGNRHSAELAMLHGARLVTASETESGKKWAESRIKTITGGDPITAQFMRQDYFTYTPQFKLLLVGNHRPGFRDVDEALRRRIHLWPFDVTIPAHERDPELSDRLRVEWSGILRWAIEGCLAWQREGLSAPVMFRKATTEYLDSEDAYEAWISDRCVRDVNSFEKSSDLYADWKRWAEQTGEQVVSQIMFSKSTTDHGFRQARSEGGSRGFTGLRLIEPVSQRRFDEAFNGSPPGANPF
ncbi:phage/plasmid primase, P4 family [Phyllobacterium endophyticum]|uniref:phage/plasmid primase, P4 family n=1 Tax=Phyllobacterium endophyticum TaxID=1149773 RepID=UPI001FDF9305|nr:phage/plasmid primase, P4 family [Phyllobacterium endophyticum]